MKILVINTNGHSSDTAEAAETARRYAHVGTEILAVHPAPSPLPLVGYTATSRASEAVLSVIREHADGCDAVVIACFEDPGLYAAREQLSIPVFGIAESAMLVACTLGHSFSIVTTPARYRPITTDLVRHYGLDGRCASVRTVDLPDPLPADPVVSYAALLAEGRRALDQDGAEVLILGCSKFSRFDKDLECALQVPVLDGVACAVKLAEACVGYGLKTSKRLGFAAPDAHQ